MLRMYDGPGSSSATREQWLRRGIKGLVSSERARGQRSLTTWRCWACPILTQCSSDAIIHDKSSLPAAEFFVFGGGPAPRPAMAPALQWRRMV
eukprot:9369116-Pyramimonas_sp.AAC.1